MKRSLSVALLVLAGGAAMAPASQAKGLTAAVQGATVDGLPYRYVAISSNSPYRSSLIRPSDEFTFIGRVDKRGGRIRSWWYLPARYSIPAAAYDDTAGGLSAYGGTLVLTRFSWIYPPRTTGLAILDTDLNPRPRRGQQRPRHAFRMVNLPGGFSFDAISPDGSTVYLIEHLSPVFGGAYQVRALDAKTGKLLPEPIVDPSEPWEQMEGTPMSRVTSADGRWAYTLYTDHKRGEWDRAHEPFIHALDTVGQRAICIDLPQLEGYPTSFVLALRTEAEDGRLAVLNRSPRQEGSRALLTMDTRSFEVTKPESVATASSGIGPWPPIVALSAGVALLLAWVARRNRDTGGDREPIR